MMIGDVLSGVCGVRGGPWDGTMVRGIATDSRRLSPGDLFVALPGASTDGAAFLVEALRRGASAVVLRLGHRPPAGLPYLLVRDPHEALRQIAANFYGDPSAHISVIGITGTNGKTTVTSMTSQILTTVGLPCGYWSSNEVWTGARRFRPTLTTAMPHDLQHFLREVRDSGMPLACMEVSSHAAAQGRIDGLHWRAGAVTCVTRDHVDYHGSYAAYLAAKRRFLEQLPASALLAYNIDDHGARLAAAELPARAVSYGFSPDAAVRASRPRLEPTQSSCLVRIPGEGELRTLLLPVPGRHNLANALAALTLTTNLGVPVSEALTALAAFHPPARRLHLAKVGPYLLVDDIAMNDASVAAVMQTLADIGVFPMVVVAALRGNRGPEVNADMARSLAAWQPRLRFAPVLASLSTSAVTQLPFDCRVRPDERDAFVETAVRGGLPVIVMDELEDAIAAGIRRLPPGGVLVLLGTFGMDEGEAIAHRLWGAEPPAHHPPPSFG